MASISLHNDFTSMESTSSTLRALNINNSKPEEAHRVSASRDASSPVSIAESSSGSGLESDTSEEIILHKLSRVNGCINKMNKEELEEQLKSLNLNASGVKDVLKKRLKNYHKQQKISLSKRLQQADEKTPFKYLVVIDFEATCARSNENYVHEIIEFPAVLIDVHKCDVTNVFQRFCRPQVNPQLTAFCTELTGITQSQVDKAKDFSDVYAEFIEWLKDNGLGKMNKFAIVTDGPWDMARFLKTQVELSGLTYPSWARQWINLRKAYSNFYNVGRVNLQRMLDDLGMVFQGRPHCGLDDSRNIAAIAIRLLKDGCIFKNNEHLRENSNSSPASTTSNPCPGTRPQRKGRFPPAEEVTQEGENMDDLLRFAQLQKS